MRENVPNDVLDGLVVISDYLANNIGYLKDDQYPSAVIRELDDIRKAVNSLANRLYDARYRCQTSTYNLPLKYTVHDFLEKCRIKRRYTEIGQEIWL
jgi:hypothetical protein